MLRAGVMEDGSVRRPVTGTPQGGVVSPLLANIYLHRVDRAWDVGRHGVLVRYADDLVVMCRSRQQAEAALGAAAGAAGWSRLGAEGGQDPDRAPAGGWGRVRFPRLPPPAGAQSGSAGKAGVVFLARWPAKKAMQHARDRVRELTDRSRLLLPVEWVTEDVNRFLRGWAAYFRYRQLRRPVRQDQRVCPDAAGVVHHSPTSPQSGVRLVRAQSWARPAGPVRSHWNRGRPQTLPGLAGKAECRR